LTSTLRRKDKDQAGKCVKKQRKDIVNACFVFLVNYPPLDRNAVVWVDALICGRGGPAERCVVKVGGEVLNIGERFWWVVAYSFSSFPLNKRYRVKGFLGL
jgi:hypothetical protein